MIFGKRNLLEKITPTFTRASVASYIDSTSGIVNVASGELRETEFGLLLEKAITNLSLYSEGDLSTYPTNSNVQNAATSITTLSNAIDFYQSGVDSTAYKSITTTNTVTYTLSAFVEMDDAGAPSIGTSTSTGDFCLIVDGSIVTTNLTSDNVFGNVYRITGQHTSAGSSVNVGIAKYTAQSSRTFKVSGIQLEQNSYATSYIKTEASTVTRAVDNLTYELGAGNFPQEFQIAMAITPLADGGVYNASEIRLLGTDDTTPLSKEFRTFGSVGYSYTSYAEGGGALNLLQTDFERQIEAYWLFSLTIQGANVRAIYQKDNETKLNSIVAGILNHSDTGQLQIGRYESQAFSGFYSNIKLFSKD